MGPDAAALVRADDAIELGFDGMHISRRPVAQGRRREDTGYR
jgi:hypothetical protein